MKPISARTYLFVVLSILTAIPVLWLGSNEADRYEGEVRAWHDRALESAARDVSWQLAQLVQSRVHDLEALAASVGLSSHVRDPVAMELMMRDWRRTEYFTGMYLADAEGNGVARTVDPEGTVGDVNYADRDYYKELIRTRRTAISRVQQGKVLDAPSVQIAAPIFDRSEKFVGYAEGSVSLQPVAALIERYAAEVSGSRLVIIDGHRRVVADSNAPALALADVSLVPLFSAAPLRPLDTGLDEKGILTRAAAHSVPEPLLDWRAVALEPQAKVEALTRAARRRTQMATLGALLGALLLSAGIAYWAGRRISGMTLAMKALGRGEFNSPSQAPKRWEPRELQDLTREFDAMSDRIRSHSDKLEQLVAERTSQLAGVNARLELLVQALEHAEDGIEVTDMQGVYLYVNPAMERITGYSAKEMLGKTPKLLRSGRLDDAFYQNIADQVTSGNVYKGSFVGRRKDGSFFEQEITIWPVHDQDGVLVHCVGLRRDVTERRKTEHALRVSERMASVGTLAAGAAHEINNPLTYTLLSLSHIERQLTRNESALSTEFFEQVKQATAYAKEGAQRVQAIVRDLRSFSRVDDVTLQRVDPNTALESALRMLAMDLRHRATLEQHSGVVPAVVCNPAQLSQVLLNLLVNALQALEASDPRSNQISVVTSTDEKGNAVIAITDTGRGIEEANLSRIFDPFFTTKPVGEGTGLGLSMCHNLVTNMGGEIQVSSELGKGSTFRVVLPPAAVSAEERPTHRARDSKRAASSRILVIDDDRAVGESLRVTLEHHEVCVAHSAGAGLEQLEAARFDVILCDVMMPGMDGVQFFDHLVARGMGEEHRLVFITGGALTSSARSFLERTDIVHLVKPLDEHTLEDAIARRLAGPESKREAAGQQ